MDWAAHLHSVSVERGLNPVRTENPAVQVPAFNQFQTVFRTMKEINREKETRSDWLLKNLQGEKAAPATHEQVEC